VVVEAAVDDADEGRKSCVAYRLVGRLRFGRAVAASVEGVKQARGDGFARVDGERVQATVEAFESGHGKSGCPVNERRTARFG
jgi:hypothetical protein